MSSMLLKPIMRRPSQSIDEYRELTFVIGSPIVFQTAPPHPASNARMTCSPQFVGGADASQNGLRHLMPQNVLSSVGLGLDMLFLQPCSDADASPFAVRNRVHNLAPAVGTVSASEELRVRCLASPIDRTTRSVANKNSEPCCGIIEPSSVDASFVSSSPSTDLSPRIFVG